MKIDRLRRQLPFYRLTLAEMQALKNYWPACTFQRSKRDIVKGPPGRRRCFAHLPTIVSTGPPIVFECSCGFRFARPDPQVFLWYSQVVETLNPPGSKPLAVTIFDRKVGP